MFLGSLGAIERLGDFKQAPALGWGLTYGNSSVGRASVSKTEGRGFESSFPCNRVLKR